jgi:hypothetical protein
MTEGINAWLGLGLGLIYSSTHQAEQHWPLDGHPQAAKIIFDIDHNNNDAAALVRPPSERNPSAMRWSPCAPRSSQSGKN